MIIKAILTNIKNVGEITYDDIQKCNFLIGWNGTGKSAFLEGMSLAAEGKTIAKGDKLANVIELSPTDSLAVRIWAEKNGAAIDIDKRFFTKVTLGKDGIPKESVTQEIFINSSKKKTSEATRQIDEWFGNFILRVDMKKMLDMSSKDLARFLFELLGNKLGDITTSEICRDIFRSLLRETTKFQGLFEYDQRFKEKKLNDMDEKELESLYLAVMGELGKALEDDEVNEVYENFKLGKIKLDEVNQKQEIRDYISSLVENVKKFVNDNNNNRLAAETALKKLSLETNVTSIDESKLKREQLKTELSEINNTLKRQEEENHRIELLDTQISGLRDQIVEIAPGKSPGELKEKKNPLEEEKKGLDKKLEGFVPNSISDTKDKLKKVEDKILADDDAHNNKDIVTQCDEDIDFHNKKIEKMDIPGKEKTITEARKNHRSLQDGLTNIWKELGDLHLLHNTLSPKIECIKNGICPTCGTKAEQFNFTLDDINKELNRIERDTEKKTEEHIIDTEKLGKQLTLIENLEALLSEAQISVSNHRVNIGTLEMKIKGIGKIPKFLSKKELEESGKQKRHLSEKIENYGALSISYKRLKEIIEELAGIDKDITKNTECIKKNAGIQKQIEAFEKAKDNKPELNIQDDIDDRKYDIEREIVLLDAEIEQDAGEKGKLKTTHKWEDEILVLTNRWKFAKQVFQKVVEYKDKLTDTMLGSSIKKAQSLIRPVLKGDIILTTDECGLRDGSIMKHLGKLSGGEVVIFLSAVLSSLMIEANVKEKIIIVEGGELDDNNIVHMLSMFEKVDELDNVFLTYPHNKIYDAKGKEIDLNKFNWNIIRMG